MIPQDRDRKVTIEDLLRLKRSERPSSEFWGQFESELHRKQLTALVHKRPWWHRIVPHGQWIWAPAGAAAAVAFTLVSVRFAHISAVNQPDVSGSRSAITLDIPTLAPTVVAMSDGSADYRGHGDAEIPAASVERAETRLALSADVTELVGLQPMPEAPRRDRPSEKSIAANLARLEQSEPEMVNALLSGRLSSAPRAQIASAKLVESVDSAPRYRLIARYADHSLSPEPSAPAPVRERIARRLGDDITDRISRIGVEGSRVSLKF